MFSTFTGEFWLIFTMGHEHYEHRDVEHHSVNNWKRKLYGRTILEETGILHVKDKRIYVKIPLGLRRSFIVQSVRNYVRIFNIFITTKII